MNILIVEDDTVIADAIGITLSQAGYHYIHTRTIEGALNEINHNQIDAVLLDINLPDGDGTRLTRLIRKSQLPAPILVISGNSRVDDRITALGAGADGYLTKPFDRHELLAHMEAIIRRANGHSSAQINIGNMVMDLNRNLITINKVFVPLTQKEYQIMHLFCMRREAVLSKDAFISHIYGGVDEPDSKIIDVFICKLRRKLDNYGLENAQIDTVWGQGYVLREDEKQVAEEMITDDENGKIMNPAIAM